MEQTRQKKICRFLSLGPSLAEAPWKAPDGVESWGIQYTWRNFKLDRVFVMDDQEWIVAKNHSFSVPIDIEDEMRKTGVPVYVAKKWESVPNTVEYPIEEIKKEFSVNYFMNSMAYMFALAIHEGFERIETYGIDFRYFDETGKKLDFQHNWLDETHCGAFWAGVATGRGIEVVATKRSSLMKPVFPGDPAFYGYEVSPTVYNQRRAILEDRKKIELKQKPEKLMVFRPEPGESEADFRKRVESGAAKPIGEVNVRSWEDKK